MNIRNIPEDVKLKYRAICVQADTTLRAAIIAHMRETVKQGHLRDHGNEK